MRVFPRPAVDPFDPQKERRVYRSRVCPNVSFCYPPNSRAQNPFDRSASSSARSSSARCLSASARWRSSSTRALSRSRSSRAVDSACAVSSKRPSRRPSSRWRSWTHPEHVRALLGGFSRRSWGRCGRPRPPLPRPSWRPCKRARSRRRPATASTGPRPRAAPRDPRPVGAGAPSLASSPRPSRPARRCRALRGPLLYGQHTRPRVGAPFGPDRPPRGPPARRAGPVPTRGP